MLTIWRGGRWIAPDGPQKGNQENSGSLAGVVQVGALQRARCVRSPWAEGTRSIHHLWRPRATIGLRYEGLTDSPAAEEAQPADRLAFFLPMGSDGGALIFHPMD